MVLLAFHVFFFPYVSVFLSYVSFMHFFMCFFHIFLLFHMFLSSVSFICFFHVFLSYVSFMCFFHIFLSYVSFIAQNRNSQSGGNCDIQNHLDTLHDKLPICLGISWITDIFSRYNKIA